MYTYYVAGLPYSDELYHHGIKGQKWGVRRYQNEDGTLTAEGRRRYGNALGQYASGKYSVLRKFATGDWALGNKRLGDRREQRLSNKIEKAKSKGKDTSKLQTKYEIQKTRNIARDTYNSKQSTGKLLVQKLMLGDFMADSYRSARGRGRDIGEAAVESMVGLLTGIPALSIAYDISDTKKQLSK